MGIYEAIIEDAERESRLRFIAIISFALMIGYELGWRIGVMTFLYLKFIQPR